MKIVGRAKMLFVNQQQKNLKSKENKESKH